MIRLKKCSLIWLTLLLLLIATAVNAAEKNFVEIDIYSVNDFHGHLRAEAADPGIAVLSGVINELMKQNPCFWAVVICFLEQLMPMSIRDCQL